jgi:hypothetical protein
MIRQFGGLERFIEIWKAEIDIILVEKPGSALALQSLAGVVNLLMIAEQVRQADRPPEGLTDEELRREVEEIVRGMQGRDEDEPVDADQGT